MSKPGHTPQFLTPAFPDLMTFFRYNATYGTGINYPATGHRPLESLPLDQEMLFP